MDPHRVGGGGILRDSDGRLIFAFAEGYTGVSSLQAEARALCTGLKIYSLLGVTMLMVEGDSKGMIDAIQGHGGIPASATSILCRIGQIGIAQLSYNHIYREGNAVADSLATFGILGGFLMMAPDEGCPRGSPNFVFSFVRSLKGH
ncbi:uncharacterized protein [Coffea arabica]|uniref:RNase H type-1 domain-containing protein n=1 Tax=Coffea arabica TaxID=13443 RepID=A0ABM4W2X1_COFAR